MDTWTKANSDAQNSRFEGRRAVFYKIILIFLVVASLAMTLIAHSPNSKLVNIVSAGLYLTTYFVYLKKPRLAMILLGLFFQVFISIHAILLDPGGQTEFTILAFTPMLPILYRNRWSTYFFISNAIIFHVPYLMDAYDSYFRLTYVATACIFFVIRRFIDEGEDYERKIDVKQKELLELNDQKNQLIEIVAHDLKAPLNQIIGCIDLIDDSNFELKNKEINLLDQIKKSATVMSHMISQILNIEAIENKKLNMSLEPVSIIDILDREVCDFAVLAKQKGISFITKVQLKKRDVQIMADRQYLCQVLQNLMSNALKFSPKDSLIRVEANIVNDKVQIRVIDNGPGISDKEQKQLFTRYAKLSAKPTDGEDSSGLGLSITKKFVEAMDGKIWCESALNQGSTFTIEFKEH